MSEEHDNHDFDREDIEDVENMLYANIHYDSGSIDNQTAPNTPQNTDGDYDADRRLSANRRNAKRYWTSGSPALAPPRSKPFHKEKQSGIYKVARVADKSKSAAERERNEGKSASAAPKPKAFTPYVSFLSFTDSTAMPTDVPTATPDPSPSDSSERRTNNDMLRKSLTTKQLNPFSKQQVIDTYNGMYKETDAGPSDDRLVGNKKRLNPFNALSQKAKRKKSESKNARKHRKHIKEEAVDIIEVDGNDDDDDDVIILPTQPPPLICVDTSDDEAGPSTDRHEFVEPNVVSDSRRKGTRCASPSSSIQSADDFIAQNDQRTFGFETFGTMSDEDLCQVSEAIENRMRDASALPAAEATTSNDTAIFTPPKQMQKDKTKTMPKNSYEVGANSFTAVDVYESESSDMPDSIYAKGARKRKIAIDSDSSSVESISITKAKRLRKRKSSGSAKESDHLHSDDSSSDLPDDDDDSDDDDEPGENSYLVRGEALGKVKSSITKKNTSKSSKTKTVKERSKDDFINKLSDIVNGQNNSDDDIQATPETSVESVEARDIVETVLQRRTKKAKKDQLTTEVNEDANPMPAPVPAPEIEKPTAWSITDQPAQAEENNPPEPASQVEIMAETEKVELVKPTKKKDKPRNAPIEDREMANKIAPQETVTNKSNLIMDSSEHSIDNPADNVPKPIDLEAGWNAEMKQFYNESWGGETFSVRSIRSRMPKSFMNWIIASKDAFPNSNNQKRCRQRCLNCQEIGHLARSCPKPRATKRCKMCGTEGHLESRCPNTICLQCGRESGRFSNCCYECNRERDLVCYICKQKGHRRTACPDQWRRYHSTTTLAQPLVQASPADAPQRKKYCSFCGYEGHYVEKCNRVDTRRRAFMHSARAISSYTPVFNGSEKCSEPKYTILSSDLNDYSFNFGKDVSCTGNNIYARFLQAVQRKNSEQDVAPVNESDSFDTPIEVYDDDFDATIDDYEDVSSSSHFSSDIQSETFMTNDTFDANHSAQSVIDLDADELNANVPEVDQATNKEADTLETQLNQLNEHAQRLSELKDQMEKRRPKGFDEEKVNANNTTDQREDVSTSTVLPDFIPLNTNEAEKFEPARSPSPVSADSTTVANEKCDATIHITAQHCKYLVTEMGSQFLHDLEKQCQVTVRMEWRSFGNVLVVNGVQSDLQCFHDTLKSSLASNELSKKVQAVNFNLPKKRDVLIKYIQEQVVLLEANIGHDVRGLYQTIQRLDGNPSKASTAKATRLRRTLNMVLCGRYGLGEGKHHLEGIQRIMNEITRSSDTQVSYRIREDLSKHLDYIFGNVKHDNYIDMMEQYNSMRKEKMLPPLNLDRKLFGLKMNFYPKCDDESQKRKSNPSTSAQYSVENVVPLCTAMPSSSDIQINVSTSSNLQSIPDESFSRGDEYVPLRSTARGLDQWKY